MHPFRCPFGTWGKAGKVHGNGGSRRIFLRIFNYCQCNSSVFEACGYHICVSNYLNVQLIIRWHERTEISLLVKDNNLVICQRINPVRIKVKMASETTYYSGQYHSEPTKYWIWHWRINWLLMSYQSRSTATIERKNSNPGLGCEIWLLDPSGRLPEGLRFLSCLDTGDKKLVLYKNITHSKMVCKKNEYSRDYLLETVTMQTN